VRPSAAVAPQPDQTVLDEIRQILAVDAA